MGWVNQNAGGFWTLVYMLKGALLYVASLGELAPPPSPMTLRMFSMECKHKWDVRQYFFFKSIKNTNTNIAVLGYVKQNYQMVVQLSKVSEKLLRVKNHIFVPHFFGLFAMWNHKMPWKSILY